MKINDKILYKNQEYGLYLYEGENIFHPSIFDITPVWSSSEYDYQSTFNIQDFKLILESFWVRTDSECPPICNLSPKQVEHQNGNDYMEYKNLFKPLNYTGAIIIVNDLIDTYGFEENFPCYCYQDVIELIFNEGTLTMTVDHGRAMIKIRKNIDAGFRNPRVKKDARCINRYIKLSLIGDYKHKKLKNTSGTRNKIKVKIINVVFNKDKMMKLEKKQKKITQKTKS